MSRNSPDYTCAPFSGSGVHRPRARKTIRDTRGLSNRRLSGAYRACKKERREMQSTSRDSLFLKHNKYHGDEEMFLKDLDGTGGLAVHLDICPPNKLSTIMRIFPSISRTCARISLSTLSNRATPPLIPHVPISPRLGFCPLPLVCFLVVTFHLICCSNTIKTTDSKNHIVNNFNGEIATWIIHIRNMAPTVCRRFIFFPTAHPRYSIKSSFMKKIVSLLIINKNNNVK
ncbi:hypothetical protein ALC56_05191 [Trachymyrmex septentrionalis]|uniref:Uncharacterized protein n=1 Tax=Trachymyrmex septentrionalis TaxID=34720 RepID=A0A195FIP9_9HYME|nr:hypothetical protein ALC56_05191 [Trachymyrmex septentrionalis]